MRDWNVVVTSAAGGRKEHLLLQELRQLGEFAPTGFRSVYLGRVEDVGRFLEDLREARELMPESFGALGHVVPVEERRSFEPGGLQEALREAVLPWAGRVGGQSFVVRVKRRGYKGAVASPMLERELAELLFEEIERLGEVPRIEVEDPDLILAVALFPNRFGLALISREVRQHFPFVKVK